METLDLDAGTYHPEALLRAAQVLAGRGKIWLRTSRRNCRVLLDPLEGGDGPSLAAAFLEEAAAQELRRRIAAANRPVREYIVTQALLAASGERGAPGPPGAASSPAGPALNAEEEGEIQRLIREAEAEIAARAASEDPEGIAPKWEERPERPDKPGESAGA